MTYLDNFDIFRAFSRSAQNNADSAAERKSRSKVCLSPFQSFNDWLMIKFMSTPDSEIQTWLDPLHTQVRD